MFVPTTFEIQPESTAFLVVDMQRDFLAPGAPYENAIGREAVETINRVSTVCRAQGIPVIFTAQAHRADGSDIGRVGVLHPVTASGQALRESTPGVELYPTLEVEPTDHIITKRRFSAFFGTDLEVLLRGLGVTLLIVAGVAGNVCCESTIRDAFYRDFEVIYLSDATGPAPLADRGWGAFDEDSVHRYVLTMVSTFFGEVAESGDVLARIASASHR
ncbi:MAG: isochorismatase family cysteine hydrolase [Acidimicrobiia bacterium]